MAAAASDVSAAFAPDLLSAATVAQYQQQYASSGPYQHAVIPALIDEALLHATRREISHLSFTDKETDIYKIHQTGDMANLDGLPAEEAAQLPALMRLRNALYSAQFRAWLQRITGCGPLSAQKKDMSINAYRAGCHLLNHDDVISTRRLSYILYLTDPAQAWQPEWGGALELYPVKSKHTPDDVPSKVIPPQWNQLVFFTVQPGHSFHSVEEVVHPSQSRLSISGWFHRPQAGEEGFTAEDEHKEAEVAKEMSSLDSLSAKENAKQFEAYPDACEPPLPGSPLSQEEKTFLSQFLNPAYLVAKTQKQLVDLFVDASHLLISDVLRKDLAEALEHALRLADARDGFQWWSNGNGNESTRIQPHVIGTDRAAQADAEAKQWSIAGPPHKQRYAVLSEQATPANAAGIAAHHAQVPHPFPTDASALLRLLSSVLFPSLAFRHLLANLTHLVPLSGRPVEARRFRPGLDYTLARSDTDTCLDVTLNLTPDVAKPSLEHSRQTGPRGLAAHAKKRKTDAAGAMASSSPGLLSAQAARDLQSQWDRGDVGGWECYMAPHEGDDDPTVYKSAQAHRAKAGNHKHAEAAAAEAADRADADNGEQEEDEEASGDDGADDDSDGVLLNLTPSFNTLSVVLRDEGVMRFVKYLSASAGGSRWDVIGEFEVGSLQNDEEEERQDAQDAAVRSPANTLPLSSIDSAAPASAAAARTGAAGAKRKNHGDERC